MRILSANLDKSLGVGLAIGEASLLSLLRIFLLALAQALLPLPALPPSSPSCFSRPATSSPFHCMSAHVGFPRRRRRLGQHGRVL